MALSIRHKLVIAFSLLALVITLLAFLAMLFIFRAGFLQYLNDLRFASLEQLQETVSEKINSTFQWQRMINSERLWHELVRESLQKDSSSLLYQKHEKKGSKHALPPFDHRGGGRPPPRKRPPPHQPYLLLGSEKNIIYGRIQSIQELQLVTVTVDNNIVGYLAVSQLKDVSNSADKMFLETQTRYFIGIALAACLFSIIVAFFIANWMSSPIQCLVTAMNCLMARDYTVKVNYKPNDEIGSLVQSFNQLALSLADHQQSQQQWIADISHELRTPLSSLKAELEAMLDGIRILSIDRVHSLHEEVLRLQRLVDDLHELALSDSGALNYRFSPVSVNHILSNVFEHHEIELQSHQLDYESDMFGNEYALYAYADTDRLYQLFENLLQNSLRYTDCGGKIKVTTRLLGNDSIVIAWEDTAPSVSAEAMSKLFDRLYREEKSRNREKGGSGLGLSICKAIVKAHSGDIHSEHSLLGGVKITIVLPKSKV